MTPRERVIASLNHQQPDKTPYCIGLTEKAHAKMAAYYGDSDFADTLGNALAALGTTTPDAWKEIAPDIWEDEFGVQWNRSVDKDIGVAQNQQVIKENLEDFVFPDPEDEARWAPYPETLADKRGLFWISNLGFSLFERAWTLCGMENLLMAMAADPDFAHALLERILENNLARIERACAFDIDGMMFGDDWGSQRGLIMGPEMWREYIGPRVRQMYQAVRRHGKCVFIHSFGKVDELFPDLIDAGLHCFNPFQPEVMDVYDVKREYGGELSFFGGISTQQTLPYGTPQQTRDEVRRLLDDRGIPFTTLRRRSKKMLDEIYQTPRSAWRRIQLDGVSRQYKTPRILDAKIALHDYQGPLRQLTIMDLGHEEPTLLLTNQLKRSPAKLIARYAQRMLIENGIQDGVDFFHMDALSSAVAMKVNCDLQLTLMASSLYRLLGTQIAHGYQDAKSRHIFRDFVDATAHVRIGETEVEIRFQKRAHNPLLAAAEFGTMDVQVPWLGNKHLRFTLG